MRTFQLKNGFVKTLSLMSVNVFGMNTFLAVLLCTHIIDGQLSDWYGTFNSNESNSLSGSFIAPNNDYIINRICILSGWIIDAIGNIRWTSDADIITDSRYLGSIGGDRKCITSPCIDSITIGFGGAQYYKYFAQITILNTVFGNRHHTPVFSVSFECDIGHCLSNIWIKYDINENPEYRYPHGIRFQCNTYTDNPTLPPSINPMNSPSITPTFSTNITTNGPSIVPSINPTNLSQNASAFPTENPINIPITVLPSQGNGLNELKYVYVPWIIAGVAFIVCLCIVIFGFIVFKGSLAATILGNISAYASDVDEEGTVKPKQTESGEDSIMSIASSIDNRIEGISTRNEATKPTKIFVKPPTKYVP